jgi:hypothetical protein
MADCTGLGFRVEIMCSEAVAREALSVARDWADELTRIQGAQADQTRATVAALVSQLLPLAAAWLTPPVKGGSEPAGPAETEGA